MSRTQSSQLPKGHQTDGAGASTFQEDGLRVDIHFINSSYKMNHSKRGRCIVFHHYAFCPNLQLEYRKGTEKDIKKVKSTFSLLGFDVIVYNDLSRQEILDKLSEESKANHTDSDCLVVIVMTHGEEGNKLYAYDEEYDSNTLWKQFTAEKCSSLAAKPKLFFIQACRGKARHQGVNVRNIGNDNSPSASRHSRNNTMFRIPNESDFLIAHSTVEGYISYRDICDGTWFIQSLCKVFETHYHNKDVLSMLTMVNRKVAFRDSENVCAQMPQVCHTLTRDLKF